MKLEHALIALALLGFVHDMTDIDFSEYARKQIEAVQPGLAAEFEKAGFTFTAGRP